jgi:hypothetical protein
MIKNTPLSISVQIGYIMEFLRFHSSTIKRDAKGYIMRYCCSPIESVKDDENLWAINRKVCQTHQKSFPKKGSILR